jgi:hypothetical protein
MKGDSWRLGAVHRSRCVALAIDVERVGAPERERQGESLSLSLISFHVCKLSIVAWL